MRDKKELQFTDKSDILIGKGKLRTQIFNKSYKVSTFL